MKKFLNICLVFLLLFSTFGIAISKHYCGEILQKIAFKGHEKSCCEKQEMPEGCCNNEVSLLKSDDHKVSQHDISIKFTPFLLYFLEDFVSLKSENKRNIPFKYHKNHSPPGPDIIIFVQSFRL